MYATCKCGSRVLLPETPNLLVVVPCKGDCSFAEVTFRFDHHRFFHGVPIPVWTTVP